MSSWFPQWQLKQASPGEVVAPDERLPWGKTIIQGAQHTVTMFGATVLAPLLMGFDPNVAILMSGVGTLLFFLVVGGRVPSYLGSSFAFIGAVIAVTGYAGAGPNKNIGMALGGIIACGLLYTLIGLVVHLTREVRHTVYESEGMSVSEVETGASVHWIEKIMPPVVTGAVVAVIGLNLAPIAAKGAMGGTAFEGLMALGTVLVISLIAVFARGMLRRLLILAGLVIAYVVVPAARQRHGARQADRLRARGGGAAVRRADLHRAGVRLERDLHDRAGGADPRGREPRPPARGRGDHRPRHGPVRRQGVHGRRPRDDARRRRRRHGRDHLRGEHRRDGGDAHLLDAGVPGRRAVRGVPRLQPEVRRADPDDPGTGAGRRVDRGLWLDHRGGRTDLGCRTRSTSTTTAT